ncbi:MULTISPECIES: MBL fold metallo-hydrolase [Hyphomicrobiales]|jgi:glyoxylase-like metal-dependent hydrolase (beta-lactamase superfamily II)|uniref:Glyoxylase-like metal-dependent hydrolase (Beta-lactamase superfamily II) n=2 Tax=Hyphomicrobiales TaxID=356 RepID=A0A9W6FK28_XANFL|nr:MBL fold metallo-hydrolase [Xanthobacter flavus]MBA4789490.1 MBL fold metallo-hydrolase [Hyphomicrobiales bacterium]MDR6332593.1 glyoxylase-like metal-dependent hydrolase (beta-lactamase superfamily II) [Xanthobacter flavus]GLI20867.1 MBL fold metallo-hydrolase [Xanthobacter flavus]
MTVSTQVEAPELSEVAPGILRVRVPLPFPPREVSAWLLSGADGWTLIDSGVDDAPTRDIFTRVLADPRLGGAPVERLLVTHFHPDHIGLAGWLHGITGADLHMSRTEWLQANLLLKEDPAEEMAALVAHCRRAGAPQEFLEYLPKRGMLYPKWVGPLPRRYLRVAAGDVLKMAGTEWRVMIGEGHAPEMICLHSAERDLLIAADQILGHISPHIGVQPSDPGADNLCAFLRSLETFEALPAGTHVLPSHGEPFDGLHARIAVLKAHHEERLARLIDFCATPRTAMDTLEVLFRPLPLEQTGFGLSEALAHLRHLVFKGALAQGVADGRWVFTRA